MSKFGNNPYEGSTFRAVNSDLLKGVSRGGYRAGTIGVSDFQGKVMNYNKPAEKAILGGAGVSVMTAKTVSRGLLNPQSYTLYAKKTEKNLFNNLYRGRK